MEPFGSAGTLMMRTRLSGDAPPKSRCSSCHNLADDPFRRRAAGRKQIAAVHRVALRQNKGVAEPLAEASVYIEHIKKVIRASDVLGVKLVNTFVGRDHTRSIADNWSVFDERWPDIVRFAESCGVKIAIENCPMLFSKDEWPGGKNLAISPKIWREMFRRIPSASFGLNYDPSHP